MTNNKPKDPKIFGTMNFKEFVHEGDCLQAIHEGFDVVATIYRDDDQESPEGREDGFWPSLDPNSAGFIGHKSNRTLERHMAEAREVIRAWEQGEWSYVGVAVTVSKNGIPLTGEYDHAVWGCDSNYPLASKTKRAKRNDYLADYANDLAIEALADAKAKVVKLMEGQT